MKQLLLFNDYNSSPAVFLDWLAAEQERGRLYSRRELLRMPLEERERVGAPPFSRSGLSATLAALRKEGHFLPPRSVHRKIVVARVPLPVGATCFLS